MDINYRLTQVLRVGWRVTHLCYAIYVTSLAHNYTRAEDLRQFGGIRSASQTHDTKRNLKN